jgi:argininosuccinate lyase
MLKGLPTSYDKDLQEDKEPLFDAVETLSGALQITCGVISTLTPNPDKLRGALVSEMLATDLADYLVRRGVPFRESHHVAGAAVALAEQRSCALAELTAADLKTLHAAFEEDVTRVWDFEESVEQRDAEGGTSRRAVLAQVAQLRTWLAHLVSASGS